MGEEPVETKKRLLDKVGRVNLLLIASYLALVGALVFLLYQSRTPIPTVIWDTFSPSNLVVYLAMTFLLLVIIMYKGKPHTKLSLILIYSVVSRSFKQIVCESRYGYDTWVSLGYSTYLFREDFSPYNVPFTIYGAAGSLIQKAYSVTERVNLYSFGVLLSRMFSVDIYWTHLILVPVLWGVFIPVLTYKISKFFSRGETVPLLAALLSSSLPSLVGTVTTSFGLACLFYLVVVYLSLRYLSSKKGLLLAFVVIFASFITHELVGVVSFSTVALALFYQEIGGMERKNIRRVLLVGAFVSLVLLLPMMLQALRFVIQVGPTFSLKPLEGLSAYDTILLFIFGEYAEMKFSDAIIHAVFLLGLIGLIYTILEIETRQYRKANIFILLCLAIVIIDYTIIKLLMTNVPWGPEGMWTFRDMLVPPFAAIVIYKVLNYVSHKLGSGKNPIIRTETNHSINIGFRRVFSINYKKIAVTAVLILSISSLVTAVVYSSYPQSTYMRAWTTAHEIEAARYIEETTPRNETYVVLCEATTRLAGYAVVGPQHPRAYWYGPYESRALLTLYNEFISNPSPAPLWEVKKKNNASIIYVVVAKFRPPVDGNDRVIQQLMDLPYLELYAVFGQGVYIREKFEAAIYVFKARPPPERLVRGTGPSVYVHNNQAHVNTIYTLDVVTYEASYEATLTGSPVYTITDWPTHWSFESIMPVPLTKSVDANEWINFTATEDVTYTVTWTANILYQQLAWKDDTFKEGWQVTRSLNWKQPPQTPTTDGDVLTMTGVFQKGTREALVLTKDVANISTTDYPYVIVKWKSTSTCAWVAVLYLDEMGEENMMYVLKPEVKYPWAQYSPDWKITMLKMPEGKVITALRIALDDYPPWTDIEGIHSAYYDFIMISNISKPKF